MNGQTPRQTTPAAGPKPTGDPSERAPIDRSSLPPGSGELDAPNEGEEIEQTLEAFRELSGAEYQAPPIEDRQQDPGDEDDFQAAPGDEGFTFPGSEPVQEVVEGEPGGTQPPPAEPLQPAAPVQTQQAPGTAPAAAPAVSTAQPEVSFQDLSAGLEQNLEAMLPVLAKSYVPSDADMELLATDPKAAYSKMSARVHLNAVSSVMRVVAQQLPVVVNGMMQAVQRNQEAENRFWNQFPSMDRSNPTHRSTVAAVARNVRAMNPNMAEAEMVRFTAYTAAAMLGLPLTAAQPQPARRAAPQMPGRQVRQTPPAYSAAGSKQPGSRISPTQRNPWDVMASLIQMGDQGRFDAPT